MSEETNTPENDTEDCWQVAGSSRVLTSMIHSLTKISAGLQKTIKEEIKECTKRVNAMEKGMKR